MSISPFTINVDDKVLEDLKARLKLDLARLESSHPVTQNYHTDNRIMKSLSLVGSCLSDRISIQQKVDHLIIKLIFLNDLDF